MPMLDGVQELTLKSLNDATLAWVEGEYNHRLHRELGCSPVHRLVNTKSVARPVPQSDVIRRAFRRTITRSQRQSDGTVSVTGRRFEVPSRFRTLETVTLRYAAWDLTTVELVDPHTHVPLCTLLPLDKQRNAESGRRALENIEVETSGQSHRAVGVAPLLQKHIEQQQALGTPPAYLPLMHGDKKPTVVDDVKEEEIF